MASYNKFDVFVRDLTNGKHLLNTASHQLNVYLSNTAPNNTADAVKADLAEFAGGTGYSANGNKINNDTSLSGNTLSLTALDVTWTAGAADWNAFRYVVLMNQTQSAPLQPLISNWDYGNTVNLGNGETFTVDFGSSVWTLQ